jgi:hypothetical protein
MIHQEDRESFRDKVSTIDEAGKRQTYPHP